MTPIHCENCAYFVGVDGCTRGYCKALDIIQDVLGVCGWWVPREALDELLEDTELDQVHEGHSPR